MEGGGMRVGERTGSSVKTSKPRPWLPVASAVMTRLRKA
jgi:hypothetical protein